MSFFDDNKGRHFNFADIRPCRECPQGDLEPILVRCGVTHYYRVTLTTIAGADDTVDRDRLVRDPAAAPKMEEGEAPEATPRPTH